MWAIVLLCLVLLVYLAYRNGAKINDYWKELGVPYDPPVVFFGNFLKIVLRQTSFPECLGDCYRKFKNERYVGIFQFTTPVLLVRDPELIKKITVQDFDHFPDHSQFIPPDVDPLWGLNLFSLSVDDGWYRMRTTLSPSFTSSKMRMLFKLMQECAIDYVKCLGAMGDDITLELKDTLTRFGSDVIGSTAFGVRCNSLIDRENEFYLMGKRITNFDGIRGFIFFAHSLFPKLMRLLKVRIVPKQSAEFFKAIITETMRYRAENKVVRPDMIHLLVEAQKGNEQEVVDNEDDSGFATVEESDLLKDIKRTKFELTDDILTAQALIFFYAAFDPLSTGLSYMFYHLAIDPAIQKKLYKEIRETVGSSTEPITYDQLLSMKYLDCVVSETLRLHPPASILDRRCLRPYTIEPEKPSEKPLHLKKNSILWIPVREIQRDPQHFYDPEKFIPERFSIENRHKINPFCYLPFGVGPRNCIGSRFALIESKLIIVEIMRQYRLVPVEKTEIPITLSRTGHVPLPKGGIWIGLSRRK